jgi:hypothetical protein
MQPAASGQPASQRPALIPVIPYWLAMTTTKRWTKKFSWRRDQQMAVPRDDRQADLPFPIKDTGETHES